MLRRRPTYKRKRKGAGRYPLVTVPAWAISGQQDGSSTAAALSLAELENRWIRLSAATQKRLLGFPVFGKRAIFSDGLEVRVMRSAAFGTDASVWRGNWSEVTRFARERRQVG